MSPTRCLYTLGACSFPRVSGDEPVSEYTPERSEKFSPRERG